MSSCTAEQLNLLLDFLEDHKDLARSELRSVEGRVRSKKLWHEVSELLNSAGGSYKSVPQWQKVWADRKHLAKKSAANNHRLAGTTGGESGCQPLNPLEKRILSIISEGVEAPETSAQIPVVVPIPIMVFEGEVAFDNENEASRENTVPSPEPQPKEEIYSASCSPPTEAEQQECPSPPRPPRDQSRDMRNRLAQQWNRRRRTVKSSITKQLLEKEDEKIRMLEGLKEEVHGLTAVIRELVNLIKSTSERE